MKNISALVLCIFLSYALGAQQFDLKINMTRGQHFLISNISNSIISLTISGQTIQSDNNEQYDFDLKVKSITKEGNYILESRYARIIETGDDNGDKANYDSDNKGANNTGNTAAYQLYDKIVGKTFFITLSPKGRVLEIAGVEKLVASLKINENDSLTKVVIDKFLSLNQIRGAIQGAYPSLPDMDVKIGDTWLEKKDSDVAATFSGEVMERLDGIKDGIAHVVVEGYVQMKNKKDDDRSKMKPEVGGNLKGFYDLDMNTGLMISGSANVDMTGGIKLASQEFPMSGRMLLKCTAKPL